MTEEVEELETGGRSAGRGGGQGDCKRCRGIDTSRGRRRGYMGLRGSTPRIFGIFCEITGLQRLHLTVSGFVSSHRDGTFMGPDSSMITLDITLERDMLFQCSNAVDKCSVLTSNVFHKKDKAFSIYSGECCSSFVLFDRVFSFDDLNSRKYSLGHETFSEHSRGRQCTFVSLAALLFLTVEY